MCPETRCRCYSCIGHGTGWHASGDGRQGFERDCVVWNVMLSGNLGFLHGYVGPGCGRVVCAHEAHVE